MRVALIVLAVIFVAGISVAGSFGVFAAAGGWLIAKIAIAGLFAGVVGFAVMESLRVAASKEFSDENGGNRSRRRSSRFSRTTQTGNRG